MMNSMDDDFAEFDTPPEEILRVLDQGEPVTFGTAPQSFVSYSSVATVNGWPVANAHTNINQSEVIIKPVASVV